MIFIWSSRRMYGSVCIRAGAHLISAKDRDGIHSRVIQTISCISRSMDGAWILPGKQIETHIEFIVSRYPSPSDSIRTTQHTQHTQHINIQQTEWGFIEFFRLTRPVIRRDYWWLCLVSLLMPGALCRVPHHTTRPVLNYNYAIAAYTHKHIVARLCSRWLLIGHCFSVHFVFVFHFICIARRVPLRVQLRVHWTLSKRVSQRGEQWRLLSRIRSRSICEYALHEDRSPCDVASEQELAPDKNQMKDKCFEVMIYFPYCFAWEYSYSVLSLDIFWCGASNERSTDVEPYATY